MGKLGMVGGLLAAAARTTGRRLTGRTVRPGWSFRFEMFADALKRSERRIRVLPLADQGEVWRKRTPGHPVLRQVTFEPATVGGVPGEWVTPKDGDTSGVVLYLHGGWYCTASSKNYRELLARLAIAAHVRVLALDYRLAPEHPFPAALDDAVAAYAALAADGNRIVVAGDSAGGGLATALMVKRRDAGEPQPAGAILICPWVDLSARGGSLVENSPYDWSDPEVVIERAEQYLGGADPKTPLASPVFADLRGLAPMLVQIGGAEMLLDQATAFAEVAQAAGVSVDLQVTPHMIHDWHMFAQLFAESRAAIDAAATFARARLGGDAR